jgi:hypothetical protein
MRIVIALGGNALLARGDKPDAAIQLAHLRTAAEAIAPLAAHHDVVICHGNGPQVGMLSLESETDHALTRPYPLDDLVAQTQGMIGYWLTQALHNAGVKRPVLGLITQTLVDAADPAFAAPTKFVGPGYARDRAQLLAQRHGWTIAADLRYLPSRGGFRPCDSAGEFLWSRGDFADDAVNEAHFVQHRGCQDEGLESSLPMERFTMFSAHAKGSHISMMASKPLGPNILRS